MACSCSANKEVQVKRVVRTTNSQQTNNKTPIRRVIRRSR